MTGEQAIARFCPHPFRDRGGPEPHPALPGVTVLRGWGGYPHADDGYAFMDLCMTGAAGGGPATTAAELARETVDPGGLRAYPACGDWPYNVVLVDPADRVVVQYVEGDVTAYRCADAAALRALIGLQRRENPAP